MTEMRASSICPSLTVYLQASFTIMRRNFERGAKARLSFSGGPQAPVNMADSILFIHMQILVDFTLHKTNFYMKCCTRPLFETEAKGNSEKGYFCYYRLMMLFCCCCRYVNLSGNISEVRHVSSKKHGDQEIQTEATRPGLAATMHAF